MSSLAFYSPLFLSIACFLAGGIWLMLWTRQSTRYMLPTALSWYALCVYFGMLAVSGGGAPIVERTEIAGVLRLWGFFTGALILTSKVLLLRAWWKGGKAARRSGDNST